MFRGAVKPACLYIYRTRFLGWICTIQTLDDKSHNGRLGSTVDPDRDLYYTDPAQHLVMAGQGQDYQVSINRS